MSNVYQFIHPDIKKFWEKEGWEVVFMPAFEMVKGRKGEEQITIASWRQPPINYFFQNEFMSETKMLRMIKLKAFL